MATHEVMLHDRLLLTLAALATMATALDDDGVAALLVTAGHDASLHRQADHEHNQEDC